MLGKIITIGLCTNQKRNIFSGQAMMFDALVDFLKGKKISVSVVNLSSKYQDIQVGTIAFKRIIEYFTIILKSIPLFFKSINGVLYITTAQTQGGFLRDLIFINLAKIFGCKIVIHQFGSNFQTFYTELSPFFKFLVRNTFNKGDKIIVEGEVTKEQFFMIRNYQTKVIPVTNGLPEKNLKNTRQGKSYNPQTPFSLIYLSYMIESKGYWDVLEAVDILVNEYKKNVSCVFSGKFMSSVDDVRFDDIDIAQKSFEKFIIDKKLHNHIIYYEGLMGENKADAFIQSNVFLLPSYFKFEGQPVSVLEAMAYGSVPIVTKYRMIPNMVDDNTGVFVEPLNAKQIADFVVVLMEDPGFYSKLSQNCVDTYFEKFTLEKYCENVFYLINDLT